MHRIPKKGDYVRMNSRAYTGNGHVIDVYSEGLAADITIRDAKGRCWTSKKEMLHKALAICKECYHTHEDCECTEDDGTPIR